MTLKRLEESDPRQKRYEPPRLPKLESQFGFAGSWDGKRRPLEPSAPKLRQRQSSLTPEEFERLSPEQKIALANGQRIKR
jgi:hypothetical protein